MSRTAERRRGPVTTSTALPPRRRASPLRRRARTLLRNHGPAYDAAATAQLVVRHLLRRPHDPDFLVFRRLGEPVLFADVGANRGQSALSFLAVGRRDHRIVSFEANPDNAPHLALVGRLLGDRFTHHVCGLGQEARTATFYVPVQGSRRLTGEGSFDVEGMVGAEARITGPFSVETLELRIERFDAFGLAPDVVKIDVQGHERSVLSSMGPLWPLPHRPQPLFMIEANPNQDDAVLEHLSAFGYARYQRDVDDRLTPAVEGSRPLNWFYASDAVRRRFPSLFADAVPA